MGETFQPDHDEVLKKPRIVNDDDCDERPRKMTSLGGWFISDITLNASINAALCTNRAAIELNRSRKALLHSKYQSTKE